MKGDLSVLGSGVGSLKVHHHGRMVVGTGVRVKWQRSKAAHQKVNASNDVVAQMRGIGNGLANLRPGNCNHLAQKNDPALGVDQHRNMQLWKQVDQVSLKDQRRAED